MSQIADVSLRKRAERMERDERLAKALRDNLHRRKEQARARAGRGANLSDSGDGHARAGLSGAPLSSKTSRHGGTTAD